MTRAPSRHEREMLRRRERAQTHLRRVRERGNATASFRVPRPLAATVLAVSGLVGALWNDAVLFRLASPEAGPALETIAVSGARALPAAEIAEASGVARGVALDRVDPREIAEQLEDHDRIASAGAVALPSGTLLLRVEERVARAVVELGAPPAPYAVDERGAPFGPVRGDEADSLPRLAPGASVTPRQPNARLAEAVRLAERLPERGLAPPEEIAIAPEDDPEGLALRLRGLPTRIVLGREDLDDRLDELATLLARRADLVARASRLDLRFAHQAVLRDRPPPEGVAQEATARGSAAASEPGPPG